MTEFARWFLGIPISPIDSTVGLDSLSRAPQTDWFAGRIQDGALPVPAGSTAVGDIDCAAPESTHKNPYTATNLGGRDGRQEGICAASG